jgi:hypothetical protein
MQFLYITFSHLAISTQAAENAADLTALAGGLSRFPNPTSAQCNAGCLNNLAALVRDGNARACSHYFPFGGEYPPKAVAAAARRAAIAACEDQGGEGFSAEQRRSPSPPSPSPLSPSSPPPRRPGTSSSVWSGEIPLALACIRVSVC